MRWREGAFSAHSRRRKTCSCSGNPVCLLLDEPSLGLAPIIVQEIYAFFTKRCQEDGTTVLLAEQMAALALKVSVYDYVLRHGSIVREGSSQELVDTGLVAALSAAYL